MITTARRRRRRIVRKNKLKKKGIVKIMPAGMLNECIGKEATIYIEGDFTGFVAKIVSVEENWIKVEQKNAVRYVNGDMISQLIIRNK